MHCPFCAHEETKVIDSRLAAEGSQVRRRRECLECHERFTTFESAELLMPRLIKRDKSREPFDEAKLPDQKRISAQHVVEYARFLSSNPEAYQKRFSTQLLRGLKPEEFTAHFAEVKERIVSSLKKVDLSAESYEKVKETEEAVEED